MSWKNDYYGEKQQVFAEHLADMVRCRTINATEDSGTAPFFDLHKVLEKNFPLVHAKLKKTIANRAALLFHWAGKDRSAQPVLLLAHQDIVEASGEWKYPPFAGKIAEGRIWGRGTLDNKGNLCAILEAVEILLSENYQPPVDIYIASSDDEEQMGNGAPQILQYFKDKNINLSLVLDEGTPVMDKMAGGIEKPTAIVGITEKGYLTVRFTARSSGGHASSPPEITPIGQLSAFICSIEKHSPFRPVLNNVVREMLQNIAPEMKFPLRFICQNIWLFAPMMPYLLAKLGPSTRSLIKTTCAFTMCKGSSQPNVLPSEASVTANLRLAIDETVADVMLLLQERARKFGLDCAILYAHEPAVVSVLTGKSWDVLLQTITESFPTALIAPTIMPAATDSRHFSEICHHIFRFSPVLLTQEDRQNIHGINENTKISNLARAVFFYETLFRKIGLP